MNKELLKSFIIGSSLPAFTILFIAVYYFLIIEKTGLINYYRYSLLAPLGLGIASLIAKYIHMNYKISLQKSYFIISILSALFISILITFYKTYKFKIKSKRGLLQYLIIFIGHLFIYNQIIYPLDHYL